MDVKVLSRAEAVVQSAFINKPSAIISINDIGLSRPLFYPNPNIFESLYLYFDDEDTGLTAITEADGNKIADFVLKWKDKIETLFVHCGAGVSRSSGVAAAILKFMTDDDFQIFNNKIFHPNMRCYRTVLNAFHQDIK